MKVAIVGAGQIADAHINEIQKIKGVRLAAICDLNKSPLLALSEKYAIPSSYTDLEALLRDIEPDVVHVTSPPSTHLEIGRKCLENGAHLYVEKPFTCSYLQARELVAEAERHGKRICIGVNRVCASAQREAFRQIRDGELGELRHIDAFFTYDLQGVFGKQILSNPNHWIARLPGQIFQNNINHPLSVILPFFSDDILVEAWADDWTGNGVVFDELRVRLVDRQNKCTAHITFSSSTKPGGFFVSYYGSEKSLQVDNSVHILVERAPSRVPGMLGGILSTRGLAKQYSRQFRSRLVQFILGKETFFSDMGRLIEGFYASMDGENSPPVSVEEILRASMVIEEVVRQIGRPGVKELEESV